MKLVQVRIKMLKLVTVVFVVFVAIDARSLNLSKAEPNSSESGFEYFFLANYFKML
jgi:hypothetical protein